MANNVTAITGAAALPRVNTDATPAGANAPPRSAAGAPERQTASTTRQPLATARATAADRQAIAKAIDELQQQVQSLHTNIQFSLDDQSGEMVVKVIDGENKTVIRQIPSEKALALAKFFKDLDASGAKALPTGTRGSPAGYASVEELLLHVKV